MKTNRHLVAMLTGIALLSFVGTTQAQYKPTGDDGITASPKLRQQLDQRRHATTVASAPANQGEMACPKCKDKITERVDYTVRGANKPVIKVVTHLCDGCGVERTVTGTGKGKTEVVAHKCTGCGAETLACCNTAKGSNVATKGMEKKDPKSLNFEVAPIK